MRKLVLFTHITLDGFGAGPNGEMDWIFVDDAIFDYAGKRTDNADAALYGRKTFEMMDSYWPTAGDPPDASRHDKQHSEWYNRVQKIVVSKTYKGRQIPNTKIISDNLVKEIVEIKKGDGMDIVIFGSLSVLNELIAANLIDDYWLLVNPVLIGEGLPLFKGIGNNINLKLEEVKGFSSGVTCLHYSKLS